MEFAARGIQIAVDRRAPACNPSWPPLSRCETTVDERHLAEEGAGADGFNDARSDEYLDLAFRYDVHTGPWFSCLKDDFARRDALRFAMTK